MKTKIILLLITLFNFQLLLAQPSIQWQKTLGGILDEDSFSIAKTSDGGSIVVGTSTSSDGDVTQNKGFEDIWVVKLSSTGTIQWQKNYGGSDVDEGNCIIQTSDGGFAIAGTSNSTDADVTGNHQGSDMWVLKLNSTGVIQWQKSLGGTGNDMGHSILQNTDGSFVVAGFHDSYDGDVTVNQGMGDMWIVKLSSTGALVWQKSIGGTEGDIAKSIVGTSDGGYVVVGLTFSNTIDVSGNHGGSDVWVVKLNSVGNIQWQKALGGSNDDEGTSVSLGTDGGIYIAGIVDSNDGNVTGYLGNYDYWVVKLNSTGVLQWQYTLGGSFYDRAFGIIGTSDSGCVVTGSSQSTNGDLDLSNDFNGNYWLVKLNNAGVIQWKKTMGGSDFEVARSITQTAEGGYLVTGFSYSNDGNVTGNHGNKDYWVVKLSLENLDISGFEKGSIRVYPNPVKDELQVMNDLERFSNYRILDISGKVLLEGQFNVDFIDVSSLSKGIYFIEMYDCNQFSGAEKFVKE